VGGYTVIDVETTGLVPEKHDRVVELAVTYVSHDGDIQDHWSTLVNPQRDVGPTSIHGVTATDVIGAPTFAELAPYVMRAIVGRILVAHNASFDLRFLAAELQRCGVSLAQLPLEGLCTMRWAPTFVRSPGRRLSDCCSACGIPLEHAHSASGDAMATALLLSHYLKTVDFAPPWEPTLTAARAYPWPEYRGHFPELRLQPRGCTSGRRQDEWLDGIVSRMPRSALPQVDDYLAVLEMAMLDGFLAEHEKDALVHTARVAGLTRGQVLDIHGSYLVNLAMVALADGVVTASERAELDRAAALLGLHRHDVDAALAEAEATLADQALDGALLQMCGLSLKGGDRVVFTGEMSRPRSQWEAAAREVGLVPGTVTKATTLVVAADPNSGSGKAAKARSYGIPIITEDLFAQLLDTMSSQHRHAPTSKP